MKYGSTARRIPLVPAAVLVACVMGTMHASAAANQPSQADVEAVYLFDFGKFVSWPADAEQGTIHLCVAGSPAVAAGLASDLANENIRGHALDVRSVVRPEDEAGCAILFLDSSERTHMDELLRAVANKPTLTVSDMPGFLSRGGMIQFQLVEKRVRFSVNLDPVNHAHLVVSSELLKVAVNVQGHAPEGVGE